MTKRIADEYAYINRRMQEIQQRKLMWESYECEVCNRLGWEQRRYRNSGSIIYVPCRTCTNPFDLPNPDPDQKVG